MLKLLFILLFTLLLPGLTSSGGLNFFSDHQKPLLENYFRIRVKTNVNQFVIQHQQPWDYTKYISYHKNNPENKYTIIRISVEKLKAKNKLMQKEFFEMLNARENPYIIIKLPKEQLIRGIKEPGNPLNLFANITFAGEIKKTKLSITTQALKDNTYFISGSKKIELSDFNLQPPQKLGGAIKVKSKVLINFGVSLHYKSDS